VENAAVGDNIEPLLEPSDTTMGGYGGVDGYGPAARAAEKAAERQAAEGDPLERVAALRRLGLTVVGHKALDLARGAPDSASSGGGEAGVRHEAGSLWASSARETLVVKTGSDAKFAAVVDITVHLSERRRRRRRRRRPSSDGGCHGAYGAGNGSGSDGDGGDDGDGTDGYPRSDARVGRVEVALVDVSLCAPDFAAAARAERHLEVATALLQPPVHT